MKMSGDEVVQFKGNEVWPIERNFLEKKMGVFNGQDEKVGSILGIWVQGKAGQDSDIWNRMEAGRKGRREQMERIRGDWIPASEHH